MKDQGIAMSTYYHVQSALFDRRHWTLAKIDKFLMNWHLYPVKEVHFGKKYYKVVLKQQNPRKKYKRRKLKNGVILMMGIN